MAQYRLTTSHISRKSKSAVASAAYQARTSVRDERIKRTFDYSRKRGLLFSRILTPDGSSVSRSNLWNMAEMAEKRNDARTAREYILNVPHELNRKQQIELVLEFSEYLTKNHLVAIDVNLHEPDKEGDERNFHAHLLATTRVWKNGELAEKADFELCDKDRKKKGLDKGADELTRLRQVFEDMTNAALAKAAIQERVSCKSLKDQGIKRKPTVHLGPHLTALERKGIRTEKGDYNRLIRRLNALDDAEAETRQKLDWMKAEINRLEAEIAAEMEERQKSERKHDMRKTFGGLAKPKPLRQSRESERWRRLYMLHWRKIARNIDIKSVSSTRLDLYIAARLRATGHSAKEIGRAIYYMKRKKYGDTRARQYAGLITKNVINNNLVDDTILPNLIELERHINKNTEEHIFSQYQHNETHEQLKEHLNKRQEYKPNKQKAGKNVNSHRRLGN